MGQLKALLIATVGLWAAKIVDWANGKLVTPPPPEPDPAIAPSEQLAAVRNAQSVVAEFTSLPPHLGLIYASVSAYRDGTLGICEVHEAKWKPDAPPKVATYQVVMRREDPGTPVA